MEVASWISALSTLATVPISIWAIISSKNNAKEIKKINTSIQLLNVGNRNISFNGISAHGNGRDGVHVE